MANRAVRIARLAIVAAAVIVMALASEGTGEAALIIQTTFTVDTSTDVSTPNCNDSSHQPYAPGNCTLAQAISRANSISNQFGAPSILFSVGTVEVLNDLPHVTRGTYISGHSDTNDRVLIFWDGGNGYHAGLSIDASAPNTTIDHLAIGSFNGNGVTVEGANFTMTGSYIGLDASGDPRPNNDGVFVDGASAQIGGTSGKPPGQVSCGGDCNAISANEDDGIFLTQHATDSTVEGNYIGLDSSGEPRGNGFEGIESFATGVIIGGTTPEAGNVVAGSSSLGIDIGAPTTVEGNLVGTDPTGVHAIANYTGILADSGSAGSVIGGPGGARNLVSGNTQDGIGLYNAGSVEVLNNLIGTRIDGTSALPNGYNGVNVGQDSSGVVGGPDTGQGNVIAFNGSYGVIEDYSTNGNTTRGNSIHDNFAGGIASNISRPTIAQAWNAGAVGTACADCTIDVYTDADGQGATYEGATTADGSGNWSFGGTIDGPHVTATATDANANTSPFSVPADLGPAPTPSPTPTHARTQSPTPAPSVTPTTTPTSTPTTERVQGDINCDGNVDQSDFDFELEYAAGLNNGVTPGACPDLGSTSGSHPWGDTNCDGRVDAADALYIAAHEVQIQLHDREGCPPVGQPVS